MIKWIVPVFLLMLFSQRANSSTVDTTKQVIRAIEIQDSNSFFGVSFYRIYHVGPIVVFQSQYQFDSSFQGGNFDTAGNSVSSKREYEFSEERTRYFVFHHDSSYGYSYDPHHVNEANRRMLVDSVLHTIKNANSFEKLLAIKPDTTTWNPSKTERKDVYVQKPIKDTPGVHISLYYTSNTTFLNESINPIMDSSRKMKLYKFEYWIQEFYSEKDKRLWPAAKMKTEMREITVTNSEELLHYIDRYKQQGGWQTREQL